MSKRYIAEILKEAKIDLIKDIEYATACQKSGGNEAFIISAPTGCGKSHYITNEFYQHCKNKGYKVLFLLPRSAPTEQFCKAVVDKTDIITVKTYQSITHQYFKEGKCNLDYDYIICDECHFFVTDSLINTGTDICFDLLYKSKAFKIFISATIDPLIEVIFEYYRSTYEIPIQVENTVISDISFFDTYNTNTTKEIIIDIMENAKKKAIIFCNSADMAKELYLMKQFKDDSLFICSEYNTSYKSYMDAEKRNEMLINRRFDCKYLICTSALDVGFSIEDEAVKDIICTFTPENWINIIQSIGRKRQLSPDDTATLHLRNFSESQISQLLKQNEKRYEHLNYFRQYGELEYMKEYRKRYDINNIIVTDYRLSDDGTMSLYLKEDKFVLAYYEYQKKVLQAIQSCESYSNYFKKQLKIPDNVKIRHNRKSDYIESQLKEIAEGCIIYTTENLDELTTKLNIRNNKRELLKRPSAINKKLQEMGKPYEIKKTEDKHRHKLYQFTFTGQDK